MQSILDDFCALVRIPSPSGFTDAATNYVANRFRDLGFPTEISNKGCVLVTLGGEGKPLVLSAHLDTLGAMVTEIKPNGHLKMARVGGLIAASIDGENCTVFPRFSEGISGTCQITNPSAHVNTELMDTKRNFDNLEIVLDMPVTTKAEAAALGIAPGDYICFEPRTVITDNGYLKSRFIDDKISVAIFFALAKQIKAGNIRLSRKVYLLITSYEEVGHGARASIPKDAVDMIGIDMGCIGEGLSGTEMQVCICAKDVVGPSHYGLTSELIRCARDNNIDYAVDVYTNYSSDADAALRSGNDLRHLVMGMGVYASHGYERTHIKGIQNTYDLIRAYIGRD